MKTALEIAQYFSSQHPEIKDLSNMKMQKLLYYAQGFYAALTDGQCLFKEELQAWEHGPVQEPLYHKWKSLGRNRVDLEAPERLDEWDEQLIIFLERIIDLFGKVNPIHLRNKTHKEIPWKQSYKEGMNNVIPFLTIREYFSTRLNELNLEGVGSMSNDKQSSRSELDLLFKNLDETISSLDSEEDNIFGLSDEVNQLAKEAVEQKISKSQRKELRKKLVENLARYTD